MRPLEPACIRADVGIRPYGRLLRLSCFRGILRSANSLSLRLRRSQLPQEGAEGRSVFVGLYGDGVVNDFLGGCADRRIDIFGGIC